ncbi:hypothetical protein F4604DRAFT_1677644 [Suillus subluteus]|nr:hypothetical protein F4604DRAFT_1677644 [Suillus subluteus]
MHPEEMRKKLQALLRTLWDEIMLPIVIVLQRDLRLTPFERKQMDVGGNYAWKMSIFVLTRQHSALIRSRRMMKTHVTPSFAAIGQGSPGVGQGEALLTIDSELELVRKLVPTTANHTTLSGDDATGAGALDTLQRNTWVHLACHGKQDREQPYDSRFAMRNEPLTLLDIMENDTPHVGFAFLSAYHTAVGDEKTPDEVIHLAAGLQFSCAKLDQGADFPLENLLEGFDEMTCRLRVLRGPVKNSSKVPKTSSSPTSPIPGADEMVLSVIRANAPYAQRQRSREVMDPPVLSYGL